MSAVAVQASRVSRIMIKSIIRNIAGLFCEKEKFVLVYKNPTKCPTVEPNHRTRLFNINIVGSGYGSLLDCSAGQKRTIQNAIVKTEIKLHQAN